MIDEKKVIRSDPRDVFGIRRIEPEKSFPTRHYVEFGRYRCDKGDLMYGVCCEQCGSSQEVMEIDG